MDARLEMIARACLKGAEDNSMTFPEIVGTLMEAGFEGYAIDYRCATATYYTPEGSHIAMDTHKSDVTIAAHFDTVAIQAAIREAQTLADGYTYLGFCKKVMAAGCAGYMVSFSGRRALYYGRDAQTHVELFPR